MRPIDADELIYEIVNTPLAEGFPYDKEWFDRLQSVIHKIIDMVENAPTVGWISVKERLPQDEQWVAALLYGLVGYNTILLQYNAMLNEFITDDGIEFDMDDVAYWVGLPEPPEVEE